MKSWVLVISKKLKRLINDHSMACSFFLFCFFVFCFGELWSYTKADSLNSSYFENQQEASVMSILVYTQVLGR
jgi:hypothetical protein